MRGEQRGRGGNMFLDAAVIVVGVPQRPRQAFSGTIREADNTFQLVDRGPEEIGAHNLSLAWSFAGELGLPEPASPIVRVQVEDAEGAVERLKRAGVSCSARSGSIRFAFHLYNDEEDVALALEALRPAAAVRSDR